ncbi:MAG TPA: acyl-CoA thioesterase [Patescibacteria group bacterium]|nr:acyl-CoA thioesterase [Patescibacteria group bacterium]
MESSRSAGRPSAAGHRVADSRVEMTDLVMPQQINPLGSVFGGWVMALMDKAAAMAATRHCHGPVATASVDRIDFLAPMRLGHIVRLSATLTQVFSSSMEVEVEVQSEDPRTGQRVKTCTAFFTMVCLGPDGGPTPAPPLILETEDEHRVAAEADRRRSLRLTRKK